MLTQELMEIPDSRILEFRFAKYYLGQEITFLLQAPQQFRLHIFQAFGSIASFVHAYQLLDMRGILTDVVETSIPCPRSFGVNERTISSTGDKSRVFLHSLG